MNSYELSKTYFDFAFENPEKIKTGHAAVYFFALDTWNRMGWKAKFGFPTDHAMEAVGIKKFQTYIAYLNDLVEWGFITMVERSKNQYTANVISINNAMPENSKAQGKALDKATACNARKRQSTGQSMVQSTGQSKDSIDKLRTNNKESSTHTPEEVKQWEDFQLWTNTNAPRITQMKEPLTIDQYLSIKKTADERLLIEVLKGMQNYVPLIKKNISASLTIQNWLKRQQLLPDPTTLPLNQADSSHKTGFRNTPTFKTVYAET